MERVIIIHGWGTQSEGRLCDRYKYLFNLILLLRFGPGASFQLFLGGQIFVFFNATGLLNKLGKTALYM